MFCKFLHISLTQVLLLKKSDALTNIKKERDENHGSFHICHISDIRGKMEKAEHDIFM